MLGVSHFLKPPHCLFSPPPIYFHASPLFPGLFMSNKGSQSKNNGMFLALQECHTSKEDLYPRESQFCKRSSRQEEVCSLCCIAETKGLTAFELHRHLGSVHFCLEAECPGVAQTHLTWGKGMGISKPLLILVESINVQTSKNYIHVKYLANA